LQHIRKSRRHTASGYRVDTRICNDKWLYEKISKIVV